MLGDGQESVAADSETFRKVDDDAADFDNLADDGDSMHDLLEPGDLVALSSSEGVLSLAVYVRSVCKQQQFYTDRGKWRIDFEKDLDYVVKGFAPPELVAPLHPYFPDSLAQPGKVTQSTIEGGVPRPVGATLLQMINTFGEQVQEIFLANAHRLDNIHDLVADETDKLEFTLEELACRALNVEKGEFDNAMLFAVHQAVRRNPFVIENDRSSLFTNHYLVQPKRIANILETVIKWVHEHQDHLVRSVMGKEAVPMQNHPLQQFIQKAQRLIRLSRNVRSPTMMGCVGPTANRFQPGQDGMASVYREVPTEQFNSNDRMIIEFLQLWCIPPSDQSLALPGHGVSPRSDTEWARVQQACETLNSEGLADTMQSIRTDWGDLPVYCVDNADAQEIDDGVSLERVPGSDDTFWIRVHIANPSAFINPNNLIMEYAASRVQTLYAPERTYPMFPESLTQTHFSLSPNRPTLTFSAKMNLDGVVLDTNVSNGIVRNVVYITHDKLRSLFEPSTERHLEPLTVGGEFDKRHLRKGLQETLSLEDKSSFHILRKLMLAFREHRRKNGAMEWPSPIDTPISMTTGAQNPNPYNMYVTEGHYILGDPIIQLHQRDLDPHEVPDLTKRNLVSLLMNLACWVSAKWCSERNIPVVYDGTYYHPEYTSLTNENLTRYGGQNWLHLAAPKGMSSSNPVHHVPLGLDAYVKSTSPLRRYADVLAHYQIEAAIRFEHENGRRFDAKSDGHSLPFSRDYVDRYIIQSRWKRNRLRDVDRASKQFWACMLLFRAFYFAECTLPETFKCLVHKPYSSSSLVEAQLGRRFSGMITSLGVRCQIITPPGLTDVDILSVVEAKILSVDISRLMVVMEATRVIKPFERVGEWC
ncbi:hypothetical protein EYZ11_007866 [Aspergillus tanneri]|uniref:RNB domain-containing protein n=1 Tax=Aspergillus tanneri TaxID=1220188 RepID=A0A4V3UNV8_9EURO|nr:hypothetical protein EYZ11_007866 [Aspergillus tanneri]